MAQYKVTYSCGHQGSVTLFGKSADRENKLEWYKNNCVCPECYKAQQEAQRAKQNELALQQAQEMSLPALTGSEKQVKWAVAIRAEWINEVKEIVSNKGLNFEELTQKAIAMYNSNREMIVKCSQFETPTTADFKLLTALVRTEAEFFIENRDI